MRICPKCRHTPMTLHGEMGSGKVKTATCENCGHSYTLGWTMAGRCFYKDGAYQFHISRELGDQKGMSPVECDDMVKKIAILLNAVDAVNAIK